MITLNRRSVTQKTLLCIIGALAGFFCVELLGRLALTTDLIPDDVSLHLRHLQWGQNGRKVPFLQGDPELGMRLLPGVKDLVVPFADGSYTVSTIALNERDFGFRAHAPREKPYAVAIGDSYTFGATVNYEQCWVTLLEKSVGQEVINMGIPSTGSVDHEYLLRMGCAT